jgi:hypothetical protein
MNKANVLTLEPAGEVVGSIYDDVRSLLMQAIRYVIENDEFLVVEKGGWDAPNEPFCLFIVVAEADGLVSVIETAPEPFDSEVWAAHIVPGQESNTLSAPASRQTIEVAPIAMMEAQSGRGASNRGTSPLPSVSAEPTHMVIRRYIGGRIAM